jgi:hypothetical protein
MIISIVPAGLKEKAKTGKKSTTGLSGNIESGRIISDRFSFQTI